MGIPGFPSNSGLTGSITTMATATTIPDWCEDLGSSQPVPKATTGVGEDNAATAAPIHSTQLNLTI
eukprot:3511347-Lingulodinium_polyedra.AAC.1